jgi:hypothetical protein
MSTGLLQDIAEGVICLSGALSKILSSGPAKNILLQRSKPGRDPISRWTVMRAWHLGSADAGRRASASREATIADRTWH